MRSATQLPPGRRRSCRILLEPLESRRLFAAHPLSILSNLPGVSDTLQPASHPALPAGFDTFAPALSGGNVAADGTPTLAEWTRTAAADESIVITGDRLSTAGAGQPAVDTGVIVFGATSSANAAVSDATVQYVDGGAASVTLPADLPADSMYLLWTKNGNGYGRPIAVNQTEAWWAGPDAPSAGERVSIYGRNLALRSGGASIAAVYLEPAAGNLAAPRWATVIDANPYKLTIALPTDLPAGSWQAWAHNGHGGEYGWSKPVTLTVNGAQAWNGPVFDVRTFGAKGDGQTDDQAAIRAAIAAAQQTPGSTVYLPAGKYLVNGGFAYLHDIRLMGDGMASTSIAAGPAFRVAGGADSTRYCLIFSPLNNVELSSLTLSGNGNVIDSLPNLLYARNATNLHLSNINFDGPALVPADIHLASRVDFSHCRFVGKEVFLGSATQVSFDACRFLMTNDSISALLTWGTQQLSLTRNIVQNRDPSDPNDGTGWGAGRFLCANDCWGSGADIYVGDNTTIGLGVRSGSGDQNAGEQINWEGTQTIFNGYASGGSASSITLAGYSGGTIGRGAVVSIVGGKGVGQTRGFSGVAVGSTLTVAMPWNVIPDASSRVVVATLSHNIVVYGNTFGGRTDVYQGAAHNASVGVEMYEGGVDVIVDTNTFRQVRIGVAMWGGATDYQPTSRVNPMLFSYVANNRFEQVRNGVLWARRGSDAGVPFVGNVMRNNLVSGNLAPAIWVETTPQWASLPGVPDVNAIEATDTDTADVWQMLFGGQTQAAADGMLVRGNDFDIP